MSKAALPFRLHSQHSPAGDQPTAIEQLYTGLREGRKYQCLLGATGTGKTFTMACVIEKVNRPTLVLAPNKILALTRTPTLPLTLTLTLTLTLVCCERLNERVSE